MNTTGAQVREMPSEGRAGRLPLVLNALPALLLAALLLALAQAGYTAEDDAHYLHAADQWLAGKAFVGTTHWELRHPHVFAIVGSFLLFGRSELAMMVPTIAAYLGVIVLTVWLVRRVADHRAATLASLCFAATPVFVFYARIPYPDLSELFWCVASFALFWKALEAGALRWFVLSGLAMSMAWMIRSSTIPLIGLYGLLFLAGFRAPRARYLAMAAGFLPPVLLELGYYWARTGNPFYRFAIDMNSLEIPTAHMVGKVAHGLRPPFNAELMRRWVPNSVVDVHWLVNPYIDFLTSPSFGLLYAAAIAAGFLLLRKGSATPPHLAAFVRILVLLAVLWIFATIYVLNLRPQPRYFMPASWVCCVLVGLALHGLIIRLPARRRDWVIAGFLAFLLVDVALVSARKDPMEAERDLVRFVARSDHHFTTDVAKSRFLLEERGLADRVDFVSGPPRPQSGQLYLVGTDSVGAWKAAGAGEILRVEHEPTAMDQLWGALAPASLAAKFRGDRGVVLMIRPGRAGP